ncbi:hypothetical protein BDZ91DRAFT_711708 [Kalaharituber pfeilii]|nr:hypothetical protein BDZ91DRAFT_711708 [Kalaharituber pfeilii]
MPRTNCGHGLGTLCYGHSVAYGCSFSQSMPGDGRACTLLYSTVQQHTARTVHSMRDSPVATELRLFPSLQQRIPASFGSSLQKRCAN